jgi:segregation and condensation protein B
MTSDRKIIESILFLAEDPVPAGLISEVLEKPLEEVDTLLDAIERDFATTDRGFVLRSSAAGWRLYSSPDCAPWLERFVRGHTFSRLTGAALETLAIIAYKQPASRGQISEIRGVDSDSVVKTLLHRGLIEEHGKDEGSGSAILFTVSDELLEKLGIRSIDELPPLASFMPDSESVEDMESKLSPGA